MMIWHRAAALVAGLLLWSASVMAIEAVMAHTVFYLPDVMNNGKMKPYIEICWQANPHTIHYKTTPGKGITGKIIVDLKVWDDSGVIKEEHYISEAALKKDSGGYVSQSIMDLKRCFIRYGTTKIRLTLTDWGDTTKKLSLADSVVTTQPDKKLFLSDIQLIDTVVASGVKSPFLKNGKQKIPLCANFLDDNEKTLRYYVELYGADQVDTSEFPLKLNVFLSKKHNELAFSAEFRKAETITPDPKISRYGSFPLHGLVSGNYYLTATVENRVHKVIATQDMFIQRLNTHPVFDSVKKSVLDDTAIEQVQVLDLNKTFVAKYDLGKIKAILKMMLPVSDPLGVSTINGFLKDPNEMYMRYFIYNFFLARNPKDPGQAWREYSNKVIEANKRFTFQSSAGYETDRGFIYLRYGEPTEIITVENEQGALPYEIWVYNTLTEATQKKDANAIFLFYRPYELTSDLRLLHSTVLSELQNPGWRNMLYINSSGGTNMNSRAEQYLGATSR